MTTDVPAEEIVDPSYIREDGEESGYLYIPSLEVYWTFITEFEVVANLLNTTLSDLKKTDLDWFEQSWYRQLREELNKLWGRKTEVCEDDRVFPPYWRP